MVKNENQEVLYSHRDHHDVLKQQKPFWRALTQVGIEVSSERAGFENWNHVKSWWGKAKDSTDWSDSLIAPLSIAVE